MRKTHAPGPGNVLLSPLSPGFFSNLPLVFPQRRRDFCPPWRKIGPKPGKAQVKRPSPGFSPSFTGVSPAPPPKGRKKAPQETLRRQIEKALAARPENPRDVPRGRQPKGRAKIFATKCRKKTSFCVFFSLEKSSQKYEKTAVLSHFRSTPRWVKWSEWRDLNSRPLDPQSSALPTAPHPDNVCYYTGYPVKKQALFSKKSEFFKKSGKGLPFPLPPLGSQAHFPQNPPGVSPGDRLLLPLFQGGPHFLRQLPGLQAVVPQARKGPEGPVAAGDAAVGHPGPIVLQQIHHPQGTVFPGALPLMRKGERDFFPLPPVFTCYAVSKNFSWMASTARSPSALFSSTEILISLVEIIWMFTLRENRASNISAATPG